MLIESGSYNAKVKDYAMGLSNLGNLMVYVQFEFVYNDKVKTLTWSGSLVSEKSKEFALKALKVCGYDHDTFLPEFADGRDAGLLDLDKQVSITIEVETNQDGKTYNKIAWVNELGGGAFRNQITKDEVRERLALDSNPETTPNIDDILF